VSGEPTEGTACPDEAEIAQFVQGELPSADAERVEAHLDACEACGQVVAELVRIFADEDGGAGAQPDLPAPLPSDERATTLGADDSGERRPLGVVLGAGAEVGRYRVLDCVGVGGMGVVYAAYDPELDRRVALKLLRGTATDAGSQGRNARLLREAQALAKLTHPNVITVHDVGTWEGQVFVAMEYIDGPTLGEWMRAQSRTWPEIRDVFVAAGRGLAAAHAAEMVHRDFKPDNVLIGRDGRVRVTDFGLARWGRQLGGAELETTDERPALARISSSGSIPVPQVSLTRTGALVGTPAYMAPEQLQHQPADAASDQFAFCVALYEAIHGERPFSGRTLVELASSVLSGRVPEASGGPAVPRSVRQAIRRGLSRRRRDRFGSMNALLAVLEQRSTRRAWPWVAGLVVLGGGAGAWALAESRAPGSAFCQPDQAIDRVWDDARREAVATAFERTGLAYATESAERASVAIDEVAARWAELRSRSCEPQSAPGEGPALVALRERCLERRRVSLDALLGAFERADAATVGRAVGAVAGLPSVDQCGDPEALMAALPPPPPADQAEAVEAVRNELARGDGLVAAGRYREGLALARRVDAEAERLGHRPLRAETQVLLGELLDRVGEAESAEEVLEQAALSAVASRHRRILVRALMARVYVLGMGLSRLDQAEAIARWAEAEIEGSGVDDARSGLWLNRGSVAYQRGDYATAERYMQRALALRDREQQPLRWADAVFNLASVHLMMGREQEALGKFREYVEVFEAELGRLHPEVASGYHNLGVTYSHVGQLEEAVAALEQAEEIQRVTLGPEHPEYARTLHVLGSCRVDQGRVAEGMALLERAIAILEQGDGAAGQVVLVRGDLARGLVELSRFDEARVQAERAIEESETHLGPDHPALDVPLRVLATIAAHEGDVDGMRAVMARVHRIDRATLGADHPDLFVGRVNEASLLAVAGQPQRALDELFELLGEPAAEGPGEPNVAVRLALADELWEQQQPTRARAQARQVVRDHQADHPMLAARGQRWLEEHRADPAPAGP